ncbi:MAG: hypothetical protein AAF196_16940 [Planctomycetota bacterium]
MSEFVDDLQTDLVGILEQLNEDVGGDVTQAAHEVSLAFEETVRAGGTVADFEDIEDRARLIAERNRLRVNESGWEMFRYVISALLGVALAGKEGVL